MIAAHRVHSSPGRRVASGRVGLLLLGIRLRGTGGYDVPLWAGGTDIGDDLASLVRKAGDQLRVSHLVARSRTSCAASRASS